MDKTILDFTEATEFAADDWIIFDSESGGGCRIKAKQIEPRVYGIDVTYTQTQTVTVDTPLNDLRQDLVVKAIYTKGRKKEVEDYTLSGTLTAGTSNITVSYHGYDEIIQVVVSSDITFLYNWDFTQSLTDSVAGRVATLTSASRSDNDGVIITSNSGIVALFTGQTSSEGIKLIGKTLEIDFKELSRLGTSRLTGLIKINDSGFFNDYQLSIWVSRLFNSQQSYTITNSQTTFNDITFKFVFTSSSLLSVYLIDGQNETLFYQGGTFANDLYNILNIGYFGSMKITGVRIYENQ